MQKNKITHNSISVQENDQKNAVEETNVRLVPLNNNRRLREV